MGKLATQEELAGDMQKKDRQHDQVEGELAALEGRLAGVGRANQQIEAKIDLIYDRQKEVTIGKRNTNCLSCAVEPARRAVQGRDGQVYRGLSPGKTRAEQVMESGARASGSSDSRARASKLLNLKWDSIGLRQAKHTAVGSRKQTHSLLYRAEDGHAQSAAGWQVNTGGGPTLMDALTEEGVARGDALGPHSQTQNSFLYLQDDLRSGEGPPVRSPPRESGPGSVKAPLSPAEEGR